MDAEATTVTANGPASIDLDWDAIDWGTVEAEVRRLRQRIFTASQAGDLKRVRNLQRLMLRSRANTLVSVRRVTEVNAGRRTPGVDGKVAVTSRAKTRLVALMHHRPGPSRPRPVRRVFIPKSNGKRRPLGIPVVADRVRQARVKNALEPEWEARFEAKSYGFRPGRGCHDALEAIFQVTRGPNPRRRWVLDADLAAAFDRVDHAQLLETLGTFPARELIAGWLRAGVMEQGTITATDEGTPQGGVISPLLLNVALHGLEAAAGVSYRSRAKGASAEDHSPVLIRYADDLTVHCHSRDQAIRIKQQLAAWLAHRGMAFNEDKTRIVTLEDGFDFLGCNVRRYHDKRLIKPSKDAIKRIRRRLRSEVRSLRGHSAADVIRVLNPIIRGWAAYYRTVVSSRVFAQLDRYLWQLLYRWARRGHSNQSREWVVTHYWGRYNESRRDRWVFGDRASGAYLTKFAWTKIVRHVMVDGWASPDDPARTDYWEQRRNRRARVSLKAAIRRLLTSQNGRCSACGDLLLISDDQPQSPQEWTQWATTVHQIMRHGRITATMQDASEEPRLVHGSCRIRVRSNGSRTATTQTT